jgi:hypothetical protein
VKKPVILPCCGVSMKEKHVLLHLVTDMTIEEGLLKPSEIPTPDCHCESLILTIRSPPSLSSSALMDIIQSLQSLLSCLLCCLFSVRCTKAVLVFYTLICLFTTRASTWVVPTGWLQSCFGVSTVRVENAKLGWPAPGNELWIQGVVNPRLFKKVKSFHMKEIV